LPRKVTLQSLGKKRGISPGELEHHPSVAKKESEAKTRGTCLTAYLCNGDSYRGKKEENVGGREPFNLLKIKREGTTIFVHR